MSVKLAPPFRVSPRLPEGVIVDSDEVSLKRLRDVVAGRDSSMPRVQAIALLLASDFPNKHRDLEAVLENEKEAPEIRYVAATSLGKVNTPKAAEILISNSHIRDEGVLAGVMMALGRIGDKTALDAVVGALEHAKGVAALQARFAATLIAHRSGLKGDLPTLGTDDYLAVDPSVARPFQIVRADDTDAELCLRSLADQPFGIEFAEHPMYQARCGRNTWMILFNCACVDNSGVKALWSQKSFLGAVAIRSEETRLYSVALLMLTAPTMDKDAVNIRIYRTNGDVVFGGIASAEGDCTAFSILALPRPGAFGVKLKGTFECGRLVIETALSTAFVQIQKREPSKDVYTRA